MVKNPPAYAEDVSLITGLGRFPLEKEIATHSNILAWKVTKKCIRKGKKNLKTKYSVQRVSQTLLLFF